MNLYTNFVSRLVRKSLFYSYQDSDKFWKSRAENEGQSSVLWLNEHYNDLVRIKQYEVIKPHIEGPSCTKVLDIGCGVGHVSEWMTSVNKNVYIDAVDFEEMIKVARKERPNRRVSYIASSADAFLDHSKEYDLCVSSGCFSAIRDIRRMKKAVSNCCKMTKKGGKILMIDPFHKWKFLSRCRFSSREMEKLMADYGFRLISKSGIIFWPYREIYSCADIDDREEIRRKFLQGERALSLLGANLWSDYKVLEFNKL